MPLRQLLYVSAARANLTEADVEAILKRAVQRNAQLSVTGLLIEVDDSFLQVLEGASPMLDGLMKHILADRRHSNVTILLDREVQARQFPDWSMGFSRPRFEPKTAAAFNVNPDTISDRIQRLAQDDPAILIETFCAVNSPKFRA